MLSVLCGIIAFAPKMRSNVHGPLYLYISIGIMELIFIIYALRNRRSDSVSHIRIISFVWLILIIWEMITSVRGIGNPVLFPCPENVFEVFFTKYDVLLKNVAYSMRLLITGFTAGLVLAVILGLVAGWIREVREFVYPIANVIAPIPAIVISPYLVAVMPSFRSASVMVIVLGVFWPTLLGTINRVENIDQRILDLARMMELGRGEMIFRVLLPYIFPGVISSLKVSVTTSVLMLNFAELMGATHGMGYFIQNSITYANYTQAVAGIICIGIVVTILNRIVVFIQKKAVYWK